MRCLFISMGRWMMTKSIKSKINHFKLDFEQLKQLPFYKFIYNNQQKYNIMNAQKGPTVIFMLGGPGSGKGTQCQLIQKNFKFHHLSAGDLLRAERKKQGSENGALIQKYIDEGKIVPSQITISLLEQAMKQKGWENGKFLIDGFPRNQQNFSMWNKMMETKVTTPFIVFLDCSEQTMLNRCIKRGETSQRSDDNVNVLKKRFQTFKDETMFVIKHFEKENKVVHINSEKGIEQVYAILKQKFHEKNLV